MSLASSPDGWFSRRSLGRLALIAGLATLAPPVLAQTVTTADTGHLTGADRMQRLIAGAKKEGTVTLYSSVTVDDMTPIANAFQKKYGITIKVWRGASGDILNRLVTEARGGRYDADVVETASPDVEAMSREKLFQEVQSPVFADLMANSISANRLWVATRVIIFSGAYNTNVIRKADLPKTYDDLTNPKWKGKLGIEGTDSNWFMTLALALGEQKATTVLEDIVTKNGISVRKGHTLLTNLVASGEVPLALTPYYHEVEPLKKMGAPIDHLYLAPVIAMPSAAAVVKKAPHPYAAMLFFDFLLSDAQKIWADRDTVPTNLKYQKLPAGLKLNMLDVPKYVDENAKWDKLFKDILAKQTR